MIIYTVHALNVWGDDEEGFWVNDTFPSLGKIEISDPMNDKEIIDALVAGNFVDADIDRDSTDIEGEDFDLTVDYKGKPALELRRKVDAK